MSYIYSKKADRAGREFIEITGFEGRIGRLIVPETIEELPVRRIGANAFSGREDIVSVVLPKSIDTLGRYAFYNCAGLSEIELHSGVEDYYDGVVKQCKNLKRVIFHCEDGNYSVMKEILADYDRFLRFVIKPVGLSLAFPAYVYDFVEDVEARVLHHKIVGSGYPYRECVTRKGIDLISYDRLFASAAADDERAAIAVAFDRLLFPVELDERAREQYEQYIESAGAAVAEVLIREDSIAELRYMADRSLISREALDGATELSAKMRKSEITALLMEYRSRHFGRRTAIHKSL